MVVAALLVATAVLLAAISVNHLFGTPTAASSSHTLSSSTGSPPANQSTRSSGPLTAAAIAAKVDPGLVDINVVVGYNAARGSATGMVLTPSGEVLTNNHVAMGATSISVTDIGNGRTYSASVVGYNRTHDVAVLQLQGASGLQTVPLGDSSTVPIGARVTALGNAGGGGGTPRVARGLIIALDQTITASDAFRVNTQRLRGLIETNAAVRPGDSGGPLVNEAGQVIGMDAASNASFAAEPAVNQGYAIPINEAVSISRQIEAGVTSSTVHTGSTGFLGVQVIPSARLGGFGGPSAQQANGAVVGGVLPGYPAQTLGLSQGDVITSVDGQAVTSATGLTDLLSAHHSGDTVQLVWVDPSGQTHTATVKLASGPPA